MSRSRIVIVIGAVLLATTAGAVYAVYQSAMNAVHNSYAVWWVADVVIEHMETHDGAWPKGWSDLRESYASLTKKHHHPGTFEELESRVDVDWSASPEKLAQAVPTSDRPPFRVIWLRDGSHHYWTDREPNQMILDYLSSRKSNELAVP
jgi:hypothetical protein